MIIAIDIDNTITYAPEFFAKLTNIFKDDEVVIVSYRDDLLESKKILEDCGIRYDRLILMNDEEWGIDDTTDMDHWKADVIKGIKADIFFEDMPEVIRYIEPPTKVFMACDEIIQQWIGQSLSKNKKT